MNATWLAGKRCPASMLRLIALLTSTGCLVFSGFALAETIIEPRIEVGVLYTDNARGVSDSGEESDFFGYVAPGIRVDAQGARALLSLDYEIIADRYLSTDDVDTERHNAIAFGQAEIARRFLFLEGQASLRRDRITRTGSINVDARSNDGNSTDVLDYNVGPVMVFGFRSWLESETRYNFSETRYDVLGDDSPLSDPPADVRTHTVSQQWRTGSRFSGFESALLARYANSQREDIPNLERSLILLENAVGLNRQFALLFSVGYENIEDGTVAGENLDGPIWAGGVRWTPGPKLTAEVQLGRRFDDDFASAALKYDIDLNTRLVASYDTLVSTSQTSNQRELGFLTAAPDGTLIDTRTGLPFVAAGQNSDLTEQDNLFREEIAALEFIAGRQKDSYSLTAFRNHRETELTGREETSTGVSAQYQRQIAPQLLGSISAGAARTQDTEESDSDFVNVGVALTYSISPTFSATLSYDYAERISNDDTIDFHENLVALRVRKTF